MKEIPINEYTNSQLLEIYTYLISREGQGAILGRSPDKKMGEDIAEINEEILIRMSYAKGEVLPSLKNLVDDSSTMITIKTRKNWKCPRKNCSADYEHLHGIYPSLEEKSKWNNRLDYGI